MSPDPIVIVGGGQAGVQLADSLRGEGFPGGIVLFADEACVPYQRPPLSKDFMGSPDEGEPLPLRGERFFADGSVDFRPGERIAAIDRDRKVVRSAAGSETPYGTLVLATGARNRRLGVAGADLAGIRFLRTLDDAVVLRDALGGARRALVVGAGFIGLEFAAAASRRGLDVTVLEFAPRVMARATSPPMSEWFLDFHTRRGVSIRLGEGIAALRGAAGRVTAGIGTSGDVYPADVVVAGIGVVPATELAEEAGLATADGIVVDEHLRTSDPDVYALGDCARFPSAFTATDLRLESVQNAVDQAKTLAKTLVGMPAPYTAAPWFWSQQGDAKLQIAGIVDPHGDTVPRGGTDDGSFSLFCYRDDRLVAVESVNSAGDHLAARRLLDAGLPLTREQASDTAFDLKAYSRSGRQVPVR